MRPLGGRWFPGHRFFELCAAAGLNVADDAALERACAEAGEYLNVNHHAVPDEAAEERQFQEFYRIVFATLGTAIPSDLPRLLAQSIVREANFEPFADTRPVLERLAAQRLPMAVLTDAWPSVRSKYQTLGFDRYFEMIVISAEERCTKPARGMFDPALQRLNVQPHEVLFVDDSPALINAADRLGYRAVLVDYTDQHTGAPRRITRLSDVFLHL